MPTFADAARAYQAEQQARERRTATQRRVGQYAAEQLRDYPLRLRTLEQVRELGGVVPEGVQHLVDVAEAIKPLAEQASDQGAAVAAPPDPAATLAALTAGEDPAKVKAAVDRGLSRATVPAAADAHWDSVLVLAQGAASRAIADASAGPLVEALKPRHAEAFEELAGIVRAHRAIAAMDDSAALSSPARVREGYLRVRELLGVIGRIEHHAKALRSARRPEPEPEDFVWWDGLEHLPEAMLRRLTFRPILGTQPPQRPTFLALTAAGATRRLLTSAELQARLREATQPTTAAAPDGTRYLVGR